MVGGRGGRCCSNLGLYGFRGLGSIKGQRLGLGREPGTTSVQQLFRIRVRVPERVLASDTMDSRCCQKILHFDLFGCSLPNTHCWGCMQDLQSVHSKETAINERYQDQISNFEREKLRTNDCKAEYNQRAAVVETLAGTLSDLSEQLDEAKDGMQEHSGRVEDSSPVIKLKQGVVKMKKETNELSLRLGVAKQLLATKQKNTRRDGLSIGSGPRNREDDD